MIEHHRIGLTLAAAVLLAGLAGQTTPGAEPGAGSDQPAPEVMDDRLELELFAEHPDIVTPTGLAVDDRGRVLVIESHTHKRPDGYDGPDHDRILMFEDTDGDGSADRTTTFHDGLTHAMQLAIHPDGSLYVSTRNKVIRLRDTDGDRVADQSELLINMETPADYPHNGLSGMAFAFDGDLYLGLGENFTQDWELTGSDGRTLTGGEGIGRVFRCEPDGSDLRRVARGLWNPYGLCVDTFGRVFATENDPGDRPPCRLLHIVPGGNFGYQRRYQAGLHVFNAWEGELPGTLPMASGTAEAPTGILAYGSDALPSEYRGTLLMGSWSDHRIERYTLNEHGASVKAKRETIIEGEGWFRPVGLDVAPDGTVYFSDWVSPSYPVHGQGRIWRLRPKDPPQADRPDDPEAAIRSADRATREAAARKLIERGEPGRAVLRKLITNAEAKPEVRATALRALAAAEDRQADYRAAADIPGPAALRQRAARAAIEQGEAKPATFLKSSYPPAVRAEALHHMRLDSHRATLLDHLSSGDPFIRSAAIEALSQSPEKLAGLDWQALDDPAQRVGILLALKRTGLPAAAQQINAFLKDPAEPVRFMAVKWIADETISEYRPELEKLLNSEGLSLRLFRGISAALNRLDGRDPTADLPPNRLYRIIIDDEASLQLRRLALRLINPDYGKLTLKKLKPLLSHEDAKLRLAAVRTLQRRSGDKRFDLLANVVSAKDRRTIEQAEAIVGLAPSAEDHTGLLMDLAQSDEPALQQEALRALVGVELNEKRRGQLKQLAKNHSDLSEPVARVLETERQPKPAPTDLDAWLDLIESEGTGDPEAGRRVFFNPKIGTCASCHRIDGRGQRVGPNLTQIHRSADRERLLESILQPSRELAPQFQPWEIETTDGETLVGLPLRKSSREIYRGRDGKNFSVPLDKIESKREMSTSLMPPALPLNMTIEELRDLLAYLEQAR